MGTVLLALGLGFRVAPAGATTAPDSVTASVSFHDPSCDDPHASWQGLVNGAPVSASDGVHFTVTSGAVAPGATATITATADAGVDLSGEHTFTHTFTDAPTNCGNNDVQVTAMVEFTNPSPGHAAGWQGFVNGSPDTAGDHVTFAVTSGEVAPGKSVTITATAENGYVLSNGQRTQEFTHTFTGSTAGDTEVTATVVFTEATSGHGPSWAGFVNGSPDTAGDHVTFAVTSGEVAPGKSVTITATAENGYVLSNGQRTQEFTHTFTGSTAGDTEVTATVVFTEATSGHGPSWAGFVNGSPDTAGDHVTFAVTSGEVAPGKTVTITATAENGYVLSNGQRTQEFTHTFTGSTAGDTEVTATVVFTEATSGHGPSWAGFVNGSPDTAGDHVTFAVTSGEVAPGKTVTITATAENGYVLSNGQRTQEFTHTFTVSGTGGTGTTGGSGTTGGTGTTGSSGHGSGGVGSAGSAGVAGTGAQSTTGTGLAGTTAGTSQSVVPTSVPAGLAGNEGPASIARTLSLVMLVAGATMLLASGLVARRQKKLGAHLA